MYCLVWHKGKYWYCKDYHADGKRPLSLLDMKDSSLGVSVYPKCIEDFRPYYPSTHICTDKKQYDAVKYFQEIGVAWYCELQLPVVIYQ